MKSSAIPLRYGIVLGIVLIVYFLVLSLFGLHLYVWFSFANAFFTGVAIFMGTKYYKEHDRNFRYYEGFMAGLKIGVIGTVLFTGFFAIYASNINPDFIDNLLRQYDVDYDSELALVIFTVGTMGVVTTFIETLVCMQLFKDSWNTTKPHDHDQNMLGKNISKSLR